VARKKKKCVAPARFDYAALASLAQRQLAKILGVTGPAVTKWGRSGCPRNADKTYDLTAVARWLRRGAVDVSRLPQGEMLAVCGITRPTAAQWRARGCPRNANGSYDLAAVVRWRLAELETRIADGRADRNRARSRRETALARMAELELAEREGELLPRGATVAGWIARYFVLKSQLGTLVRRARSQHGLTGRQADAIAADVEAMIEQLQRSQPALQIPARVAKAIRAEERAQARAAKRATAGRKGEGR